MTYPLGGSGVQLFYHKGYSGSLYDITIVIQRFAVGVGSEKLKRQKRIVVGHNTMSSNQMNCLFCKMTDASVKNYGNLNFHDECERKEKESIAKHNKEMEAKIVKNIKRAIEDYSGDKVARIQHEPDLKDEWYGYWNSQNCDGQTEHIAYLDGDQNFGLAREWESDGDCYASAEIVIAFATHSKPDEITLLRQVGTRNKNGVAYVSEEWLPESQFKGKLWTLKEQTSILQQRYYDINESWAFICSVAYAHEDERSICDGDNCGVPETEECKEDCSYQAQRREEEVEDDQEAWDKRTDDYFAGLRRIAEDNGIKHSTWSYDSSDEPLRDFSKKHPFTATWVDSGCREDDHCYAVSLDKAKPTKPVKLVGDTWLDVWKSIDRHIAQKVCGHRFIETIKQEGDTLVVGCGS